MAESERISNDEILVRWIDRSDASRFQPPDHISSGNFKERANEQGLSVFRLSRTTFSAILQNETRGRPEDYLCVATTAGAIRSLANAAGQPLELDVIPDDQSGLKPVML